MAGTYIGLKMTKNSQQLVTNMVSNLGIDNLLDPSKYHITLLYAKDHEIDYVPNPDEFFMCEVSGVELLGEGEWRGLVLLLNCPTLIDRHNAIKAEYGNIHSYPELKLHTTVKYKPIDGDYDKLKSVLQDKGMMLTFAGEYVEEIRGDA